MNDLNVILLSILLSLVYPLNALAQQEDYTNDNTGLTSNTNPGTSSNLNNNLNTNTLNQGVSAFSSSFSGYSSFGGQCGLSISGGYINNNYQDSYQILATFNTNLCTNQSDLEKIRQENENKREVIRANAIIITTCINARSAAVRNGINPDTICQLNNFQMPRNP